MHDSYDITIFDEIDSTNNEAKRRISDTEKDISRPFVIAAHAQTSGRGRHGRSFYSPGGTGVYMTVTCPTDCPIEGQVTMTTKAAVAVSRAIEGFFGKNCAIKWVNDIFIDDRKCCGILCEAVNDYEKNRLKYVVIGVGVNVSTEIWPEEIAHTAGSVRSVALTEEEFRHFTERIAEEILKVIYEPDGSEIQYYREHSYVIGREITFTAAGSGETCSGLAVGIDDKGGLKVRMASGEIITLDSGEITVRLKES